MNEAKEIESKSEIISIGQLLIDKKKQVEKALPKHLNPDKLLRIVSTEITRNPKLKECTASSLVSAVIQVAQLGLFPDSLTGEAYLIPYRNNQKGCYECQLQAGYKGLLRLAYNSGQIETIEAYVVHENDFFDYSIGTKQFIDFRPNLESRGGVKCYFAIAHLKNGGNPFVILSKEDVNKHKSYSKTANSNYSPWTTHYDEMAKKTAIKVLLKYLPSNSEDLNLPRMITLDDQAETGAQDTSYLLADDEQKNDNIQNKSSRLSENLILEGEGK